MKNRILVLFLFAVASFIVSCEKDAFFSDNTELGNLTTLTTTGSEEDLAGGSGGGGRRPGCMSGQDINPRRLPQAILDYIAANYTATIVKAVTKGGRAFAVALSDRTVLIFKADGTFVGECDRTTRPPRDTSVTGPHGPRDSIIHGPRDTVPRGPRDTIRGPRGPRDSTIIGPGRGPGRGRGPR